MKKLLRMIFGEKSKHTVSMDPALMAQAREVVAAVDADIPNAAPENKHARAFALLRRRCPDASLRDVSLAIELALRG